MLDGLSCVLIEARGRSEKVASVQRSEGQSEFSRPSRGHGKGSCEVGEQEGVLL